jgi:hypothetical protein
MRVKEALYGIHLILGMWVDVSIWLQGVWREGLHPFNALSPHTGRVL